MRDLLRPPVHDPDSSESELPSLPGLVGTAAMMFLGITMYKMVSKRKPFSPYYLTPKQRRLLIKVIARGEEKRWDFSFDEDFMFKLLPALKAIALAKRAPGGMLSAFLLSATAIGLFFSRRMSNISAVYTKALRDKEQSEEKRRAVSEELQKRVINEKTARTAPPQKAGITVLLVDDHAMVRQGLRSVMEAFPNIEIVGEASNGNEAIKLVERSRPAVVLMDINMPKLNGIEATARIKTEHPNVAIIGLSVNTEAGNQEAMKKAGATMLLPKEAVVDELYNAILSVSS